MKPLPPGTGHQPDTDDFRLRSLRPSAFAKAPPCQINCPCGTSVRDWIATIAQRKSTGLSTEAAYELAWLQIVENNPFPAIMGRICPHPCEDQCSRADKDGAVSISTLERFLGDWALQQGLSLPRRNYQQREESVGVVGAGPAGLSYAYQMSRRGYRVTVYDWHPEAGGMLRYGVPAYRLPRTVLDAEIARITDLGVELFTGARIGSDLPLSELRRRHELLFLGLGAQQGLPLNVPGENGPGVWVGTDFLTRYNEGNPVLQGGQLLVIGGGNTAIDVARIGRRSGAQVRILYRRRLEDMPAIRSEVLEAQQEGVEIDCLVAPLELVRDEAGSLRGLKIQQMRPGALDANGRPEPVPLPGQSHTLGATAVVIAVSQQADWRGLEALQPQDSKTDTSAARQQNLGFGGDVVKPGIASHAIAEGKVAAEHACGEFNRLGECLPAPPPDRLHIRVDHYPKAARSSPKQTPVDYRLRFADAEISRTLDEGTFLKEVQRCMSCGSCFGCQLCWMYCNAGSFTPIEKPEPGSYFSIDPDVCEGCGKCIELCPCGFLTLA